MGLGTSTGFVLPAADGKVTSLDAVIMTVALTSAVLGTTIAYKIGQRLYCNVERACRDYGFAENIIRDETYKRLAKVYAARNGRMAEFNLALIKYLSSYQ